jgi:hypothetical protein
MVLHHDLVAGAGQAGFRDGGFADAQFANPLGIVVSPDGTRIYVADRDNHRIRVVRLDQASRVETLSGTGRAGCDDGPRTKATFHHPQALALLPGDRLAVWEAGNQVIRAVDLKTGAVAPLAGSGGSGRGEGPAVSVPMSSVWSLAYDPGTDSLFYSQPFDHALSRLELATGLVQPVLLADARLPSPGALVMFGSKLHVADRDTGRIYRLDALPESQRAAGLAYLRSGTHVVALAAAGDRLYALQAASEEPWLSVTTGQPVQLASRSGDVLRDGFDPKRPYLAVPDVPMGFTGDPRSERAVLVAASHVILGLKDYEFGTHLGTSSHATSRLTDFEYPKTKAPSVYRLLMVGDSRIYYSEPTERSWGHDNGARMDALPKRLELDLNLHAALEDRPLRYEVLTNGELSAQPVLVWTPTVPPRAAAYDVDRVLLVIAPSAENNLLQAYVDRRATAEGVPSNDFDPEYLLTDAEEKIVKSQARRFLEICREKGKLKIEDTKVLFTEPIAQLAADPALHKETLELIRRPLRLLQERLRTARTRPIPLSVVFLPPTHRDSYGQSRDLWREACAAEKLELVDLVEPIAAAREAFSPIGIPGDLAHFNTKGHELLALVLAWRLEKMGLIPF